MAKYKISSANTSGISLGERFIGVPGEHELSDSEVELISKFASVEPVNGITVDNTPDTYEPDYSDFDDEDDAGDDIKEITPTKLSK